MENTKKTGEAEFQKTVFDAWMNYNMEMMKKSYDIAKDCWNADNFEKFYGVWSSNTSEMMDKVLRTPEFLESSWEMFKNSAGIMRFFEEQTKMNLKSMNVPTMDQLDELSERINYLDDKLENLEEKLDSIQGKIKESAKEKAK